MLYKLRENLIDRNGAVLVTQAPFDQQLVLVAHQDGLDRLKVLFGPLPHVAQEVQRNAYPEDEVNVFYLFCLIGLV